jgi:hypothetical protein
MNHFEELVQRRWDHCEVKPKPTVRNACRNAFETLMW